MEWLNELFRHMTWADRHIWDTLQKFPKAAENKEIKEKLCHIHQAQLAFYQIWMGLPVDMPDESYFKSVQDMIEWAEENHTKIRQFVEQIDPEKLDKEIKLPWTKNVAKSIDEYELDPLEQVKAFEKIDRLSLELLGVYHSHPHHPCYPSELDKNQAFYPEVAFIIISLLNYRQPEIRAFRIDKGEVVEEQIVFK